MASGNFDIFEIDLETEAITNLTNDHIHDAAPTYSPDGKWMAISSTVGGYSKIFRIDVDNPTQRLPVREGLRSQTNETDPVFSPDGQRLYFTSDASGANNIFSFDLESGMVQQHTDAITGCFQPTVLAGPTGRDRVVYTGYWKGRFDLYLLDVEDPITPAQTVTEEQIAEAKSLSVDELPRFEPSIEVTIDDANKDRYRGRRFYLQDVIGGTIGISDDQTFIAQIGFFFTDFLGDQKIIAIFQSVSSLANFDVIYQNLKNRYQWQVHLFDHRDFFTIRDPTSPDGAQRIDNALALTGLNASIIYPWVSITGCRWVAATFLREINFDVLSVGEDGEPVIGPRKDDYPQISGDIVGDTSVWSHGAQSTGVGIASGDPTRRILTITGDSSALTAGIGMDFRQYIMLTQRINIAFRSGEPTIRATPRRRSISAAWTPSVASTSARSWAPRPSTPISRCASRLIDYLAIPFMQFANIRGNIFLDIGGAYYR